MARHTETPEGRSVRLLRVGEQVRHALSDILMRGDVHDETLASHLVSVTEVRMSPDLRHATWVGSVLIGPIPAGEARGRGVTGSGPRGPSTTAAAGRALLGRRFVVT